MPHPRRWTTKPLLLGAVGLTVLVGLGGAAYQSLSERHDLSTHPPPGVLVDIGEARLHLYCTGRGTPTVLLEAGLGNDVNHWARVQPAIAEVTRVCAYDRAGLGWSEAGPMPREASRIVAELSQLLDRAEVPPPYVLVGHSNGAAYVRLYAAGHPTQVAGLALVDPNAENAPACEELPPTTHALYGSLVGLAPFGVPRVVLPSLFPLENSALPADQREVHGKLRARTSALRALWSEWQNTCDMLRAVRQAQRPDEAIPVILLSAGTRPPGPVDVGDLHRRMADSLDARLQVVEGSGHWIQLERPQVVVDAVRELVEHARQPGT